MERPKCSTSHEILGKTKYEKELEKYIDYLEQKLASNTEGKLQAVEDLIEFARNNCREWNNDEMEEIIDRL